MRGLYHIKKKLPNFDFNGSNISLYEIIELDNGKCIVYSLNEINTITYYDSFQIVIHDLLHSYLDRFIVKANLSIN